MIKKQSHKKNGYSSVVLVIFFLFLILTFRSFSSKPFKVPKEVQAITGTLNFNAGIGTQTLASPNMANLYVTGNVGIGTTGPGAVLHIGTATSGNQKLLQIGEPGFVGTYGLVLRGDSADGVFKWYGLNNSVETTNPILSMNRINGNVGIGISPTYKLEVGGHTVVRGDIYCESCGNWLSTYLNQAVKTSSSPTFYTLTLNSSLSSSFAMIRGGYTGTLNNAGNGYFALGIGSGWMQAYTGGAVGGSAAWTNWSDIRLKKNIDTISDPLSIITQLRGVSFNWKDPKRDQKTEYGFIAQEVEQVLPSLITEMGNGNDANDKTKYKSITSSEITPFLVEGMKEQQTQITSLQSITTDFISNFKEGLIETKKLIVDGVDILKKLNELSVKVESQQRQIDEMKKSLEELKK